MLFADQSFLFKYSLNKVEVEVEGLDLHGSLGLVTMYMYVHVNLCIERVLLCTLITEM